MAIRRSRAKLEERDEETLTWCGVGGCPEMFKHEAGTFEQYGAGRPVIYWNSSFSTSLPQTIYFAEKWSIHPFILSLGNITDLSHVHEGD